MHEKVDAFGYYVGKIGCQNTGFHKINYLIVCTEKNKLFSKIKYLLHLFCQVELSTCYTVTDHGLNVLGAGS